MTSTFSVFRKIFPENLFVSSRYMQELLWFFTLYFIFSRMAKPETPSSGINDPLILLQLFEKELLQIEDEFMRQRRGIHVSLANKQIEASDTNIPESVLSTWGSTDQGSLCFDHLLFDELRKQKKNLHLPLRGWRKFKPLLVINISSRPKTLKPLQHIYLEHLIDHFIRLFLLQDRWLLYCKEYHTHKAKILGGTLTPLEWYDLRMILEERRRERATLGILSPRLFSFGSPYISSAGNLDKYGELVPNATPAHDSKWDEFGEWAGTKWNWKGKNARLACILVSLKCKEHLRVRSFYNLAAFAWKHFLLNGEEVNVASFQSTISWFVNGHYKGDAPSKHELDFGIYVLKRKLSHPSK